MFPQNAYQNFDAYFFRFSFAIQIYALKMHVSSFQFGNDELTMLLPNIFEEKVLMRCRRFMIRSIDVIIAMLRHGLKHIVKMLSNCIQELRFEFVIKYASLIVVFSVRCHNIDMSI